MYRKRLERSKKTSDISVKCDDTPKTKTRKLLRHFTPDSRKTVRKILTFHYSLMQQLKENYKSGKKSRDTIVVGHIMSKYRYRYYAKK